MAVFDLRPAADCRYAEVSLGEVMLRLDPGAGRIRTARSFDAWEGGGEYNVARGLTRVFGLETSVVTALVDDEVGHLIESLIAAGGVGTSMIHWADSDGVGREVRNGLNFTERGFGVRGAKGVSDRGHTAIAALRPDDVDWDHLFGELGVRWLHTGGIYAALSPASAETPLAAVTAAQKYGTRVSYDLNYRPSLWRSIGGQVRAQEVNQELAKHVDLLFGNEEDFTAALGFEVAGTDESLTELPPGGLRPDGGAGGRRLPEPGRHRHHPAQRPFGLRQRLGSHRVVARRGPQAGHPARSSGGLRPGRRRGLLRLRLRLRSSGWRGPSDLPGVRRRPRRPGHDHPRRHLHGDRRRGVQAGLGRFGAGRPLSVDQPPTTCPGEASTTSKEP
ncbi:KHG/KDPG family aldolase/carbohydrate kinase, PfkB family [Acidipropionibacterium acidipropionici ATCC 4875]|uniref:KHG/KDPG family aldolase/carbohydrate kinase, PfkB family n=1 Tax=Acidipropionibacterium acidipropionici (strain ATCC 4875 / DSM 20272 / JCM 6432 / NBRC 12425 / NCIMB 8070 / 4) TaxID=1171373 RepID=K7SG16_ACIA4|nr:KHG/KDPG family aldolase/carbohydrate kinase, PfkB family [Acidipropionibacterium acidipropionici ATCC 4875]